MIAVCQLLAWQSTTTISSTAAGAAATETLKSLAAAVWAAWSACHEAKRRNES